MQLDRPLKLKALEKLQLLLARCRLRLHGAPVDCACRLRLSTACCDCACRVLAGSSRRQPLRNAHTGPSLDKALQLFVPFASTLEKLDLAGNKLGGAITEDITAFTKLTELRLSSMDLEGAFGLSRIRTCRSELRSESRAQVLCRIFRCRSRGSIY